MVAYLLLLLWMTVFAAWATTASLGLAQRAAWEATAYYKTANFYAEEVKHRERLLGMHLERARRVCYQFTGLTSYASGAIQFKARAVRASPELAAACYDLHDVPQSERIEVLKAKGARR